MPADPSHDRNDRNIVISTGTIVKFLVLVVLLVALYYISDILLVIVAAVVIASSLEPVVRRLARYGIHRIIGSILVYFIIALVLAVILIFFMPIVVNDAAGILGTLPHTISLSDLWSPLGNLGSGLNSTALGSHTLSMTDFVSGLQSLIIGTSASAFQTVSFVFGGVLSFILIIVLSFYLSVQDEGVDDFLRIVTPVRNQDYVIDLWKRSQRKIGYWLQGQLLLGILVGVLVYLVLMVVGIPHALILAVIAAIFEVFMPVFGPIISSVPAILIAFADKGAGTGLLLIGLYIIIYQFESQLFYPVVVKKVVGISPIVVILALIIGAKLAGVLGALISVPLSAALMEYVYDVEKRKKTEKGAMTTSL